MKKVFLSLMIVSFFFCSIDAERINSNTTQQEIGLYINYQLNRSNNAVPIKNKNSREVLVPIRAVTEALGYNVTWNVIDRTVYISSGSKSFVVDVDKKKVQTESYEIANKDIGLYNDRCYIPLNLVEEIFDAEAEFNDNKNIISIITTSLIDDMPSSSLVNAKDKYLWDITVKSYLEGDLWVERDIYDAGEALMIPLHAAFKLDNAEWKEQLFQHFRRFVAEEKNGNTAEGTLNRLQYLYLASQYIRLAHECGQPDLIPMGLTDILYNEVNKLWYEVPAWQWGRKPFSGGISERIEWKLNNKTLERSYYRAVIDEELFLFAIAADLRTYENLSNSTYKTYSAITEILTTANRVFHQEVMLNSDGSWVFQPGAWTDHPDYAYVGNTEKNELMEPKKINGIAADASHSSRFPLWINSLLAANSQNSEECKYYENLLGGLEKQFVERVLVSPDDKFNSFRTNNFMDGRNGVYRWNYATQGKNNGYGPYELSGTLIYGWWSLLGTDRIREVYYSLASGFPLSEDILELYVGPNTTRERNEYTAWPNYFTNGFAELTCRLAWKLQK